MKHSLPIAAAVVLAAFAGSLFAVGPALASRNSSGVYSLPSSNPVVSGTTISSSWANTTLSDIGTELTNSLDRSGRGAMTAPLQCSSGTVSAPALTFSAETSSGLYRAGSGDVRMSVSSTDTQKWTATGAYVYQGLTATNSVAGNAGVTATGGSSSGVGGSFTGGATNGAGVVAQGTGSGAGISATGGSSGVGGTFAGQGGAAGVKITSGGLQVGSSGTIATASYAATKNQTTSGNASQTCGNFAVTVTGATVGGACHVSTDSVHNQSINCAVTGADTVTVWYCNPTAISVGSYTDNFRIRVWQP